MSEYDPTLIAQDATAFAQSRFGQHYLARLEKTVERAQSIAESLEYTDNHRAHQSTKAATLKAELDYFKTAQTVVDSPVLLRRLRDGFRKRTGKEASPE